MVAPIFVKWLKSGRGKMAVLNRSQVGTQMHQATESRFEPQNVVALRVLAVQIAYEPISTATRIFERRMLTKMTDYVILASEDASRRTTVSSSAQENDSRRKLPSEAHRKKSDCQVFAAPGAVRLAHLLGFLCGSGGL